MVNKIRKLFASAEGKKIYATIEKAIFEHNMLEQMRRGVLVGFSGGADSVMLLSFLFEMRSRGESFPILACHINHMIRGDEADRDERFSAEFAKSLDIDFVSYHIDVPKMAEERSLGIEETARNARYSQFCDIIKGRNDIHNICVAHNATDNAETILLNIIRGAGTKGAAGIPPVRDNILRPLIYLSKKEITDALDNFGIDYVVDSTNFENDYSRNYIRNQVIAPLSAHFPNIENSFTRFARNLRCDEEYFLSVAEEILTFGKKIPKDKLTSLHKSILCRVLSRMAAEYDATLESVHFDKIAELLPGDDFEVSLPRGLRFVTERGMCYITDSKTDSHDYCFPLENGENPIPEYNATMFLTEEKVNKTSLNVYKKSIQADISSAIIVGRLFVRPRENGDSVFYGGMTHKLKKLFNDRKIPKSKRDLIPILCDDRGVVYVPGFGARDDSPTEKKPLYFTVALHQGENNSNEFYI